MSALEVKHARAAPASGALASAFVYANAGSGKTAMLTTRIVRLMLWGVHPAKILALTYTKSAAATMAERVFGMLSRWTALEDDALRRELAAMGEERVSAHGLAVARRLFARALETPGGLKIQTIHAFCERVLQLFPFEANVPPSFRVLDEREQRAFIARAADDFYRALTDNPDPVLEAAMARVADEAGGAYEDVIAEALAFFSAADTDIAAMQTPHAYGEAVRGGLLSLGGLAPTLTADALSAELTQNGFSRAAWDAIAHCLSGGGKTDQDLAATIRAFLASAQMPEKLHHLAAFYLLKNGAPRGMNLKSPFVTKAVRTWAPDLLPKLEAARDAFVTGWQKLAIVREAERSGALATLALSLKSHYGAQKAQNSALDFDDLIARTAELLKDQNAAWVLYRLDQGIDHILLDEAQDTGEAQWQILRDLTAEFGAGAGAYEERQKAQGRPARSLFAVGDEKQSIYGFRGAEPKLFAQQRDGFADRLTVARGAFRQRLPDSWRSSPTILRAVDAVFANPDNFYGLSADADTLKTEHIARRRALPGMVELWPLVPVVPKEAHDEANWALAAKADYEEPAVTLAKRIAALCADLLNPAKGHYVHERGSAQTETPRAVKAGDIMILLRTRSALFEAILRQLKARAIPVAGADRLTLGAHIGVEDLLALGRVCLLPQDDVALASVLKSPLFGFDDADLLRLAPMRPGSLENALARSPLARDRQAHERLCAWRRIALDKTPFAFYAHVLSSPFGRKAFFERLGPEVEDVLSAFMQKALEHGTTSIPALARFIRECEDDASTIKRDLDVAGDLVRVMTVHGAKGMEAKIVIVPDTVATHEPGTKTPPKIWSVPSVSGIPLLAWSSGKSRDGPAVAKVRQAYCADAAGEQRRLLYVALTRAEERLYICGLDAARRNDAHSWHSMVRGALAALEGCVALPTPYSAGESTQEQEAILRFGAEQRHTPKPEADLSTPMDINGDAPPLPSPPSSPPPWLWQQAPREENPPPPLRPSTALAAAEEFYDEWNADEEAGDGTPSPTPTALGHASHVRDAQRFGTLFHATIAALAPLDDAMRAAKLDALLAASPLEEALTAVLRHEVLALLALPDAQALFAKDTLFEVPFLGTISLDADSANAPRHIPVSGRLDGLVVRNNRVYVFDIKTGLRTSAKHAAALAQLGLYALALSQIYKDHSVVATIVWASLAKLEALETDRLVAATKAQLAKTGDASAFVLDVPQMIS